VPDLFEGIRIIDFSWAWAAPLATRIFSDYGAEVIRIESNTRLDHFRLYGLCKDNILGVNRVGSFNQDNTSKLSVVLNFTHPRGVEVVKRLIALADIVVENFSGGDVMKKMGLGYEELKKIKPDIILLSSSVHGHTGPYAGHPSFGNQLTSLSGFNYITGWPDREPETLGSYTDFIAPQFNCVALITALDYRRRTGKGQYIDMSQFESAMQFMSPLLLDYTVNHRIANRMGNRIEASAPHGVYRCLGEDRWCVLAVFNDEEWKNFCGVIGQPTWTTDERFATLDVRKQNEDELDKLVESWTINHQADEVMSLMQAAGVRAGILQNAEDLWENDQQLKHAGFITSLPHAELGKYRASRIPILLSRVEGHLRPAPLLGEHNEYVLKNLLGMSDDELANLVIEGVLE
jgi:benzylsuccinate CoA-transferase BbsF subunit